MNALGADLHYSLSADRTESFGGGGAATLDNRPLDHTFIWFVTVRANQASFDLQLGLPLGEWQPLATWGSNGQNLKMLTDDLGCNVNLPLVPQVTGGDLEMPLSFTLPKQFSWHHRLVAIFPDDARRIAEMNDSTEIHDGVRTTKFTFLANAAPALDKVSRYELQVIADTRVLIRSLLLQPGRATKPTATITAPSARVGPNQPPEGL